MGNSPSFTRRNKLADLHPGTFEIYMRYTDKDGAVTVASHFVWDAPRFVEARKAEAKKEGGKSSAEQITIEQYKAQK